MADNIEITAGSGTGVATDDVAGVHFQRVKLVDGTLDETTAIAAGGGVEAGALRVTIANDSTGVLSVDDNGGALTVDGTVTANLSATDNAVLDSIQAAVEVIDNAIAGTEMQVDVVAALPAGDNNIGNVDVVTLPALVAGSANIGDVDVLTLPSIPAGTNNIGDVDVLSVAAGTNNIGTVAPYAQPANFIKGATAAITDTTRTAVIAAQGADTKIYVTHILVTNGHATVGTVVAIEDGTTAIYRGYAAPAGGGFSITLPVPLVGTANTALNASCATTGSSVYVSASGYKGA